MENIIVNNPQKVMMYHSKVSCLCRFGAKLGRDKGDVQRFRFDEDETKVQSTQLLNSNCFCKCFHICVAHV